MTYTMIAFIWRKPGTTPAEFKERYENIHMPLLLSIAGSKFPQSHTRHYLERLGKGGADSTNVSHPANILVGEPSDFDYDAYAELVFKDVTEFQAFYGAITQEDAAKQIAADEDHFLDRSKMKAVVVDEINVTSGTT